jgi:site-specific DNA-methyltransferase (adenine-specific)
MLEENKIHLGDCLDLMPSIPSKSVDMILCDLPYGTTACEWDSIIDMARLWAEYERVIKDNGAIVLTANSVFTFKLYNSNPKIFKYKQVWDKIIKVGHLSANRIPMRQHEDVLLFCRGTPPYFPQMSKGAPYTMKRNNRMESVAYLGGSATKRSDTNNNGERYPSDIIQIASAVFSKDKGQHPTQKPVALFEYLIKTYTNENELVLDNCSGSGTTAVACMNTNRRFICIERDETYHKKSLERLANHEPLLHMGDKC